MAASTGIPLGKLAPGQSFQLTNHPTQKADDLICLRVHHQARNNLDADVQSVIEKTLGTAFGTALGSPALARHSRERGNLVPFDLLGKALANDHLSLYQNTFTALPLSRTYRPHTANGHGLRRHPVPSQRRSKRHRRR